MSGTEHPGQALNAPPTYVRDVNPHCAQGQRYVAEEDVGLWRLSAESDGNLAMTLVARISDTLAWKDYMEGLGF